MTVNRVSAGQFAHTFGSRGPNLAWLLGAGASADAGIPTGYDMILDFKSRLFCEAHGLTLREIDTGDPLWEERITRHFDGAHGLPPAGSPEEYALAFEAVYPDEVDRRRYIADCISHGRPSYGHRVLAALIGSRQLPVLFQTNFDSLVEDAATVLCDAMSPVERPHLTVAALDSADRAERCLKENDWPLLAKLHGDYESSALKNTSDELRTQDERLRQVLIGAASRFGLVILGYSGRDQSVIEALQEASQARSAFPSGLFWVLRPGSQLLPAVEDLLKDSDARGVDVQIVEVENFIELAGAIEQQLQLREPIASIVRAARPISRVSAVPVPTAAGSLFPVLRTSALPVLKVPTIARRITICESKTTRELQELLRDREQRRVIVAGHGLDVAAFGSDSDLLAGLEPLNPKLAGTIDLHPENESWALGLIYEAMVRSLAWGRPLRPNLNSRGHELRLNVPEASRRDPDAVRGRTILETMRAAYGPGERIVGMVPEISRAFAEAVHVRLEHHLGRWWCVFEPYTWVDLPRRSDDPEADSIRRSMNIAASDWRRERWAQRYNSRWDALFQQWSKLIAPDRPTIARFPGGSGVTDGIGAEFELWDATAWSSPLSAERAS